MPPICATDFVIATQSGGMDKSKTSAQQYNKETEYMLDPNRQNSMVTEYFVTAGIPRDQVGGVHALTSLSGGGAGEDAASVRLKVDGYVSVLERVVDGKFLVAELIAWAELDKNGKSISEWIYWPAIPARALADARRLEELTTGARRAEYLARLPGGLLLPEGTLVIHHSSATDDGAFEAFATYDVFDNRLGIVKHFDAKGVERRLPSERLNLGPNDPGAK